MASELSSVVKLQIVLARSLIDRAWSASREEHGVGLMTALLLADVAVETVTKQVLFDRNVEFGKQDKLAKLIEELEKAVPALAGRPELGGARRLREARNPVQHAGQVPSRRNLELHLGDAHGFVQLVVSTCFGIDFDTFSATHLLRAEDLRGALLGAEGALREQRVDVGNVYLAAAYVAVAVAVRHWTRRAGGVDERRELFAGVWIRELVVAVFGPDHPASTETRLEDDPDNIQPLVALGFPLTYLLHLQRLEKRAKAFLRANHIQTPEPLVGDAPTAEDIQRGIDILTQQIARLESTQPELFASRARLLTKKSEPPGP